MAGKLNIGPADLVATTQVRSAIELTGAAVYCEHEHQCPTLVVDLTFMAGGTRDGPVPQGFGLRVPVDKETLVLAALGL